MITSPNLTEKRSRASAYCIDCSASSLTTCGTAYSAESFTRWADSGVTSDSTDCANAGPVAHASTAAADGQILMSLPPERTTALRDGFVLRGVGGLQDGPSRAPGILRRYCALITAWSRR